MNQLFQAQRKTFERVARIGDHLQKRFHDMQDPINGLLLAAVTGEAILLVGPPGTGKSRLIRSLCNLLGLLPDEILRGQAGKDERSGEYFEYLLTQFTEPSELFGFFDIVKLNKQSVLERKQDGMMQQAQVVFLDEVFNASSAILNSLLTFMNERRFHDRGEAVETRLQLLVSATNHTPTEPHLAAVYDRFLLRSRLNNVAHPGLRQEPLTRLLQAAWTESFAPEIKAAEKDTKLLGDLVLYRKAVSEMTAAGRLVIDPNHPVLSKLTALVGSMVKFELSEMSNRRLVKMIGVVLAARMLRAARAGETAIDIEPRDLNIIMEYSIDRSDPSGEAKLRQELEMRP
ncbi:MAG: AAA family ATPase [Rhodobacteraceae bacterium]|nr:AAA family ATPase [Paracoccaceae bacterium]